MDINNLKHVVGKAESDKPAVIRFFGPVDQWSTQCFNEEFLWLQDAVQPSKIVVLINSEGGSVMHGMSTFSVINGCPIEVDCIIEGIAASMGSILWAAGDNQYMHDYSLLMIHNPFCWGADSEDESVKNMISAFKAQVETIYMKRFGLSKEKVKAIMDGEGEADGTWMTAKEAVKEGFLDKANIIKTSKAAKSKAEVIDLNSPVAELRTTMEAIVAEIDENKLIEKVVSIHNQTSQSNSSTTTMNEVKLNVEEVLAALGLASDAKMNDNVKARIAALVKAEGELKEVQAQFADLQIQFKGKEAEVVNLQTELDETKALLDQYKAAEQAAHEAEIEAVVNAAIEAGKIEEASKESWIAMAHVNFETVQTTLNSIQGREKITEEIAKDPESIKAKQEGLDEAEKLMAEKVKAAVGEDFKFNQF